MAKARTYYTLAQRDSVDSPWFASFGDYSKTIVEFEALDAVRDANDSKLYRVISSGDSQADIEAAIAKLNQEGRTAKAGDRIKAVIYGKPVQGTVRRIGQHGGTVFVQWDGSQRESFVHRESFTFI